jgi:hypothetical protein
VSEARPNLVVWIFAAIAFAMAVLFVFEGASAGAQQPPDLEALKARARPVLEIPGVVFTDADENAGRLVIGVENRGLETSVRQRLSALGVPLQTVEVRQTPPIIQLDTLQDRIRPIEGGTQILFIRFPFAYYCTLGFNAVNSAGVSGFVTNSHCTRTQGGVENTEHFQPNNSSGNKIGTEIADPTYFTGGDCPQNRRCRYSDSSFSRIESGVTQDFGKIARTTGANNGSLEIAGQFTITGEASGNASIGTTLNKVGRTTGWSQGSVTGSCVDINVSQSDVTQLCQDIVAANVAGGDSGSPVFQVKNLSTGEVTLYGILWGGYSDGSGFIYSPMKNIRMAGELGSLTTHSGGSATATPTPTATSSGPTATPTNTPTSTPTPTSTSTPTNTPTPTNTSTPTNTPTPTATQPPGAGDPNDMYVWDIVFESRTRGRDGIMHDERILVVVRRDSDGDGVAEATDALVSGATVTLAVVGTGLNATFSGSTDSNGDYRTSWLSTLADGTYVAEVTNLGHVTYTWDQGLDPTSNDADVDGDNLPDQSHAIPH